MDQLLTYFHFRRYAQELVAETIKSLYQTDYPAEQIVVQTTSPDHQGDYTVVVFPLTKFKIGTPEAIGNAIGQELINQYPTIFQGFNTVKGFLNLTLQPQYWLAFTNQVLKQEKAFFTSDIGKGRKVMVEFPSPNTNKPLHLGHLRNIFLGDAVCRIMDACGYEVIRACLFNDKGIHICKSMYGYLHFNPENYATPQDAGMKGDHFIAKYYVAFEKHYKKEVDELVNQGMPKDEAMRQAPLMKAVAEMYRQWEQGVPEVVNLWKMMNGWVYEGMEQTFARLNVHLDKYYYESETYLLGKEIVEEGLQKGIFYRKEDSSVWIDLSDVKLDQKLVLRSDGTSVYITQDLGTADLKYQQYGIEKSVYVIANEQDYHMKVLIEILKRLGRSYAGGMYHLSYGMVELPEGRMKTREGNVVDADDLLDEMIANAEETTRELGKTEGLTDTELEQLYPALALGAIKYYLLKVDPVKTVIFNPKESIDFKGHTGTFIQFNYARMRSILRKASEQGLVYQSVNATELNNYETDVLKKLHSFPYELVEASEKYNPAALANYAYELAKEYSRFYNECPVLKEEDANRKALRLAITDIVSKTLKHILNVLGIDAPERM
jgi:arginyl-tRNA synthetase